MPLLWLGAYLAVLANLRYPVLRFSWPLANIAFFTAAQILPVAAIGSSLRHLAGWRLISFLVVITPAALLGLGLAFAGFMCAASVASDGADRSFERQESVATPKGEVVAYRTNGGATTSFGIVVRQECLLLPGLMVVRQLGGEYPAEKAVLLWSGGGTVRATFAAYPGKRPETTQELSLATLPCLFGAG